MASFVREDDTMNSENGERPAETDEIDPTDEAVTTVELPERLVSRVDSRLDRTGYDTPSEYVAFVLEETLARVEAATEDDAVDVDRAEVEDRLESLGYLDS